MTTYPFEEKQALLITGQLCALIVAMDLYKSGNMPEDDKNLFESDLSDFLKKAITGRTAIEYYCDESEADAVLDAHDIRHTYCSEFSGDLDLAAGMPSEITASYDDEFICCLTHEKEMSLYEAAYSGPEELESEYRSKLGGLISENFDLKPYFTDISGTYLA